MLPHNVNDGSTDKRILNDKRVKIWSGVSYDGAHDWIPSTDSCIIDIGNQGRRVQDIERLEQFR